MISYLLSTDGGLAPLLLFGLLLLALGTFPSLFRTSTVSKLPLWGESLDAGTRRQAVVKDTKSIYNEMYQKFKNAVAFRVTSAETSGEKLIMNVKYLPELLKLPDQVLSFEGSNQEVMEKKYTNVPTAQFFDILPHVIKADLSPALNRLNSTITAEAGKTIQRELGKMEEWTSIKIYEKLIRVVTITSGRIFIGPELCRDERYIDSAINYTHDLMRATHDIKSINPWLKPLMAPRLLSVAALHAREDEFVSFLSPIIHARLEATANDTSDLPDDMLSWVIQKSTKSNVVDHKAIALFQLGLSFAAIHTTSMVATNIFYDLASYPEYIEPLREEMRDVLGDSNPSDSLTFASLQRLHKLDSFMKESLRMHPVTFAALARRAMRSFTLSDGTTIPEGTMLEIPTYALSRDPDFFPDPEVFRPWRFVDGGARNQFVSIAPELGVWGYGKHACPGRFFAANELKIIVVKMLLAFDVKMKDGEKERFKNLEFGVACSPDPTKEVMLRSIAV